MDKFGSFVRSRSPLKHITQDLDMNDNRITDLGPPKYSSDAVTKRWVEHRLQSEDNHIKMEMKRMEREHAAKIKEMEKTFRKKVGKLEYLSTKGGRMDGDLDMQGHAIRNVPEGTHADEPVTNGWYAKNWQDLAIYLQSRRSALEEKVKSYHLTDRSKRDLTIDDVAKSGRVAVEALEEKIEWLHPGERLHPPVSTADTIVVDYIVPLP